MSLLDDVPRHLVHPLGWTLLHFIWQGAACAAGLWLALRGIPAREANRRYVTSCTALLLAAFLPALTFLIYRQGFLPAELKTYDPTTGVLIAIPRSQVVVPAQPAALDYPEWVIAVERAFPPLIAAWMVGACVFGVRLGVCWVRLQNLRFRYVRPAEERLRRRLEEIAASIGVHRPVWLLESALTPVPTLVGWLRPTILIPASAISGLSPAMLEAILAHELAHVRRHDYIVNLLQSALEVLFFYHPATWWISNRIREERENACDDLAVATIGSPGTLGKALAHLELMRAPAPPQLAMAATGGALYTRIARLVLPPTSTGHERSPLPFALAFAALMGAIAPFAAPAGDQGAKSPGELDFAERARNVVFIDMRSTTLAEALGELTRQTGIRFHVPHDALEQRVRFEFPGVSAGVVVKSTFNLLEMDYPVNKHTGAIDAQWWPNAGPRPGETRHLSVENFHKRQTMFRQLKQDINWGQDEPLPLYEALAQLNELTGLEFRYPSELGELPVPTGREDTTARAVINAIARIHGLAYRYEDDSKITFHVKK